ncbi:carbohydrate kinase, FGGY family protein, partial [Leifsonia aquatica ATCC 14665]
PGDICLGTGTCSDWRLVLPRYAPDATGTGDTAPHVAPDTFVREVTIDSAGSALRWFRTAICPGLDYAEIIELASLAPRGSAGVRFYPFVDGAQRAPYYLDESSGVFFGITSHHGREHLARAVLEGIAFLYPRTRELLVQGQEVEASDAPLTIVDGEAVSAPWNAMKADILDHPLRATEVTGAAAVGGEVLAAVAAGWFA